MPNTFPLLREKLPEVAAELESLLNKGHQPVLAKQVASLPLMGRCRCGDSFCATIYTQPEPNGSYGVGHKNIVLDPKKGLLILDVVNGQIACIEFLYRKEIRAKLLALLP